MQQLQRGMVRHAVAADAGQRLRERADDEIHLVQHALRLGAAEAAAPYAPNECASSTISQAPASRQAATMSASGATSPLIEYSPSTTTRHRPAAGLSGQLAREVGGGVVPERKHLRAAQPRAVVDAGVALDVEEHRVVGAAQAGDDAEVRLIAGREDQRVALAVNVGEGVFEPAMRGERAVCGARSGRARAVAIEGRVRGGHHVGMKAQAEVIVRAAHQRAASGDDDFGRPEHVVDHGVERGGAVAEGGDPLSERLKFVEQAHQLRLSPPVNNVPGLEACPRLGAPDLAARGARESCRAAQ